LTEIKLKKRASSKPCGDEEENGSRGDAQVVRITGHFEKASETQASRKMKARAVLRDADSPYADL